MSNSQYQDAQSPQPTQVPAVLSKSMLNKNLQRGQSQYRVHFYLCNVLMARSESIPQLIEYVRERVSKIGNPQFIQIYEIVGERTVHVLVGMKYDFQAVSYLCTQGKKVLLRDQNNILKEATPAVSDLFEQYLQSIKKPSLYPNFSTFKQKAKNAVELKRQADGLRRKNTEQARVQNAQSIQRKANQPETRVETNRRQSRNSSSRSRSRDARRNRDRYSPDNVRRQRNRPNYHQLKLAMLGIPLGIDYRKIDEELIYHRVEFELMNWKTQEDMEYLELTFKNPQDLRKAQRVRRIQNYPIISFKLAPDCKLLDMLSEYQVRVQLVSGNRLSFVELIEYLKRFGEVVLMLAEDQTQQSFYIVYRDRQSVRELIADSRKKSFLECSPPRVPIEVKRQRKEQTFTYSCSSFGSNRNRRTRDHSASRPY